MQVIGICNLVGNTVAVGLTRYVAPACHSTAFNATYRPGLIGGRTFLKRLVVVVSVNTLDGQTNVQIHDEQAAAFEDNPCVVVINAGLTGTFTNIVNEHQAGMGARQCFKVVTAGTGGAITIDSISVVLYDPRTAADRADLL